MLSPGPALGRPCLRTRCLVCTGSEFFQKYAFRVHGKVCFRSGATGMDPAAGPAMPWTSHSPGPRVVPSTGPNSNSIVLRRRERTVCRKLSLGVGESTSSAGRDPLQMPAGQNRCAFYLHERPLLFGLRARVLLELGPASATGPATDTGPGTFLAPGGAQQ